MTNHLDKIAAPALDFAARSLAIAEAKEAELRARIAGDEFAEARAKLLCKRICDHTFADGIGRGQFSEANMAVVTGLQAGKLALGEPELDLLRELDVAAFVLDPDDQILLRPFGEEQAPPKAPSATILPFRRKPR